MKSFLVGFLLVIFYILFATEACSLEGNGQEVVMMSNNTFYNGTVGDNTTWFFLTNFTQIKDLFLSVYLIGYGTSNETQNSAVVQMLVVDDDNHGVGIVTTGKKERNIMIFKLFSTNYKRFSLLFALSRHSLFSFSLVVDSYPTRTCDKGSSTIVLS